MSNLDSNDNFDSIVKLLESCPPREISRSLEQRLSDLAKKHDPTPAKKVSRRRLGLVALVSAASVLVVTALYFLLPSPRKSDKSLLSNRDTTHQIENENQKHKSHYSDVKSRIASKNKSRRKNPMRLGRWKIEPSGPATIEVVSESHIRLKSGEIYCYLLDENSGNFSNRDDSKPLVDDSKPLVIDTPQGEMQAQPGACFYIGAHFLKQEEKMSSSMTRIFVLSGMITLSTAFGNVEGMQGDMITANQDQPPSKLAVKSNSDFAFQLYQQLAKENKNKNLFFSPYSISNALAMTAEGARQETAMEMGKVLCFPKSMMRKGNDAQQIPWRTSLIHTGLASLNQKLSDGDKKKVAEIRKQIVTIRTRYKNAKRITKKLKAEADASGSYVEYLAAKKKEDELALKLSKLSSQVDQYVIKIANALWVEKTYELLPEYIDTISRHYKVGGAFTVDFRSDAEATRKKINQWVDQQTNKRIKELIPKGATDATTRLVLTNAIYFKGEWSVPFKESNTKNRNFTLADGKEIQVPTMYAANMKEVRYGAFNADGSFFSTPKETYGQGDKLYPGKNGFSMIELPYKGNDLSMIVLVPNEADRLSDLEKNLNPKKLAKWVSQLKLRPTSVYLPKFKLETEYKLGDSDSPATLQKMGMVRAFQRPGGESDGAQFSGLSASDDLYIKYVFHKAFVEVNEKGTEAAGATAVVIATLSSAVPFNPEFKADRPFIFLIREKSTGLILFIGRMMEPKSKSTP